MNYLPLFIRNKVSLKREGAFTLLEVLLATSIVGLVFSTFGSILLPSLNFWNMEAAKINLEQDGQLALEKIRADLLQATAIKIPSFERLQFCISNEGKEEWMEYLKYESAGIPALGLKKGESLQPIINQVQGVNFQDVYGDGSLIKISLTLGGEKNQKNFFSLVKTRVKEEE